MHDNSLCKELIKMLAFLFLSVVMLVVTGGRYNSLMVGNAIETAFYRLEIGKDIRMLSFYCGNIVANLLHKGKAFFVIIATGSNLMQKRKIKPRKLRIHTKVSCFYLFI